MTFSRRRAVFLDRDGVLNHAPVVDGVPKSPRRLCELSILPEAPDACDSLRAAGFLLVVVTNQPEIARGTLRPEVLARMNEDLRRRLSLHHLRACPHDDVDGCGCRKPAPGLILSASVDLRIDLSRSFMVGDRWRDIEAGRRAGCRTVFIDRGYDERRPIRADATVASVHEAARWILESERPS